MEPAGTPRTDTATGTVGANATARPAATGTTATGTIDHDTGPLVEETTTDSGGVPGLGALAALLAIAAAAVLLGRR